MPGMQHEDAVAVADHPSHPSSALSLVAHLIIFLVHFGVGKVTFLDLL